MIRLKVSGGVEGAYLDVETCERCGCLYAYPAEHNARCAKSNVGEPDYPCHAGPRESWCDNLGPGGFMGHTCLRSTKEIVTNIELITENDLLRRENVRLLAELDEKRRLVEIFTEQRFAMEGRSLMDDKLRKENAGLREDVARAERQYESLVARVRALA